jgi:hypothetical protein
MNLGIFNWPNVTWPNLNLPLAVWYLRGLLTPVIAVVAAYIGWQQWRTNATKSKLDLFDRRFQIFEQVRKIVGLMYTVGVNDPQLLEFVTKTMDAEFLFGPEIKKYLDEIFKRVQSLMSARDLLRTMTLPREERIRLAETEKSEVQWATAETTKMADRFKKYLNLSKL